MSDDDDAGCVEHVWQVGEVHLTVGGAATTSTCARCGAVSYADDQPGRDARRPRL